VKRGDEHGGGVRDGTCCECSTKIIKARVLEVVDENPRFSF
jgi:hypothetical protein